MGFYAIRANPSPAGINALRAKTAVKLRADLDEMAHKLGGRLAQLYIKSGNLEMLAIFDLPSLGSSAPMIQLLASGGFDAGPALLRLETSAELDEALGIAAAFAAGTPTA